MIDNIIFGIVVIVLLAVFIYYHGQGSCGDRYLENANDDNIMEFRNK